MKSSDGWRQRCKAKRSGDGEPCRAPAIRGGSVCVVHGGAAPQVIKKAEERMRDLVDPAISSLSRQINADEFSAVRYVLDWAGFRPAEQQPAAAAAAVSVTVLFDHASTNTTAPQLPAAD